MSQKQQSAEFPSPGPADNQLHALGHVLTAPASVPQPAGRRLEQNDHELFSVVIVNTTILLLYFLFLFVLYNKLTRHTSQERMCKSPLTYITFSLLVLVGHLIILF